MCDCAADHSARRDAERPGGRRSHRFRSRHPLLGTRAPADGPRGSVCRLCGPGGRVTKRTALRRSPQRTHGGNRRHRRWRTEHAGGQLRPPPCRSAAAPASAGGPAAHDELGGQPHLDAVRPARPGLRRHQRLRVRRACRRDGVPDGARRRHRLRGHRRRGRVHHPRDPARLGSAAGAGARLVPAVLARPERPGARRRRGDVRAGIARERARPRRGHPR